MKQNDKYNEEIRSICRKYPCSYSTIIKLKSGLEHLRDYIAESTKQFPDIPYATRIYFVLNGITEYVKCKTCGKDIPHDRRCSALSGYASLNCCPSCAQKDPDYRKAVTKRNIERYGVPTPQQSSEYREKMKKTLANMPEAHWKESTEKRRRTVRAKYGVDSIMQVPEVAEKMSRLIGDMPAERQKARVAKIKATKGARYGNAAYVNHAAAVETKRRKAAADPSYMQRINEKIKASIMRSYGVESGWLLPCVRERALRTKYTKQFHTFAENNEFAEPLFSLDQFLMAPKAELEWRCRKCGRTFRQKLFQYQGYPARCLTCNPIRPHQSSGERDIAEFIRSMYDGEVLTSNRSVLKKRELDIYVPSLKLAVEFDGVYFHSENMDTPPDYHKWKTDKCAELGIRLIHIFDRDWYQHESGIRNFLRQVVCKPSASLPVCLQFAPVSEAYAEEFFSHNAVDEASCSNAYGLFVSGLPLCMGTVTAEGEKLRLNRYAEDSSLGYGCVFAEFERRLEAEFGPSEVTMTLDRMYHDGKV